MVLCTCNRRHAGHFGHAKVDGAKTKETPNAGVDEAGMTAINQTGSDAKDGELPRSSSEGDK